MKTVSKTSKFTLVAVLLSAVFTVGCNRQSPGGAQSSGGTGADTSSSSGTGATGSGSSGGGTSSSGTSGSGTSGSGTSR